MREHVNADDLLRFRDRSMSIAEIESIGKHLGECARCAAFAREMFRVEAPRQLSAAFDEAAPDRSVGVRRFLLAAAAVLVAIAAAAAYFLLHAPRRAVTPRTASVAPPARKAYERDEWSALVKAALATASVTLQAPAGETAVEELRGSGAHEAAVAMAPSATAIESDRPEFTWPATPGARFVVTIAQGDDVVARSNTLRDNRWTPRQPLARGRTYAWQVRVLRGDAIGTLPPPPRSAPRFRILSDAEARDVAAARAAHPDDHLLLGVLAAHYGLRDEARLELRAYASAHPSSTARHLAESAGVQ